MSRLNIPGFIKLFSVTFLFLMVSFITIETLTGFCTENEVSTLEAIEVKDDTDEGPTEISLSEVNKAREVSRIRIYGLITLWAVIALCVYLVNLQRKDDERLYQDGYYKDDE